MKAFNAVTIAFAGLLLLGMAGCTKNETRFYEDGQDAGLSIFSNTGNNVMACYVDGRQWRTRPRTTTLFSTYGTNYELYLSRYRNNGKETFLMEWNGYFADDRNATGGIGLYIDIPSGSFYNYVKSLQGKRLQIDSTQGSYFTAGFINQNTATGKGNGAIYFQTVQIDSLGPNQYRGTMAGIFEANFTGLKLTKGRFDHQLTEEQFH